MRTPYTYILYFITSCTSWDSNILFKLVFNSIKFAFCNLVYFWILYNQTVLQLQKNHPTVHDLNYTFNSLVVLLACQCLMPATSSLRDQVDTAMNPPSFKFWKRLLQKDKVRWHMLKNFDTISKHHTPVPTFHKPQALTVSEFCWY